MFTFNDLATLSSNRLGRHDVACPECGPGRHETANQRRKVLRIWLKDEFASYACARCGLTGHARNAEEARQSAPVPAARASVEAERRDADHAAERQRIALSLWDRSRPADGTVVSRYLRSRDIEIYPVPATLRYLPATPPKHPHPAMVAAFGIPGEPEPGELNLPRERLGGLHLTLLRADGSDKAGTDRDKIMLGKSAGWPIVVAPPGDGLGLVVAEGIETALSVHTGGGLGVWAAGAAGRMPGLADKIPDFIEVVTIAAEGDPAGLRGAQELADRLCVRGFEIRLIEVARGT